MNEKEDRKFQDWARDLDDNALAIWREAMMNIRQLHGDVWNGVRFFLTLNSIVFAAMIAIFTIPWDILNGAAVCVLASVGLFFCFIGMKILTGHRQYYLDMLMRKTLIENDLGFYDLKLNSIDLSFPWKVDEEYLESMFKDLKGWKNKQMWRSGTISRYLLMSYWLFALLYIGSFIVAIATFLH